MPIPLPDLPEDNTEICLVIPNSPQWRQIYMGALILLQRWWYYDVTDEQDASDVVQRVMDCHYQTTQNYEGCIDMSCEDVADCIESSIDVQNAINTLNQANGLQEVANGTWKDENFSAIVGGTCDDDVLYGMVDAVITFLNAIAEDFFEQLEEQTNVIEALGVAEDVPIFAPVLDALGSELATEYLEFLFDSVAENYLSEYTEVLEDEMECELFCFIKEGKGCEFSITDIAQFFAEKSLTSLLSLETIQDIISYLVLGSWSGAEFVYITLFAMSGGLAIDKLVAGKSWNSFMRAVLLASPSSEHTFCDPCDLPCNLPIFVDFEDETTGDCASIDQGTIVSSPAIGDFALAVTTTGDFSDPTLIVNIDEDGIRGVDVTWKHYFSPLSSRDVTIQIRAYNASLDLLELNSDTLFTVTGTWTDVSMSITGLSEDIKFVEIKSSLGSGVTPLTVAIDNINVAEHVP